MEIIAGQFYISLDAREIRESIVKDFISSALEIEENISRTASKKEGTLTFNGSWKGSRKAGKVGLGQGNGKI